MILRYLATRMMLLALLFSFTYSVHADNASETAMLTATKNWLNLLDQADYQNAWQQAATVVQQAISLEKWQAVMRETRLPLGQLKHRKIKQISPVKDLPNLPQGEYYLVIYETELSKPVTVQETLITQKTSENSWPILTYRINVPEK